MDYVGADRFYQDGGDKIKLNWFCYEYANNLFGSIKSSTKLARYRAKYGQEKIAAFCLYFSKRMRKSVYDKNTGATGAVALRDSYIYEFHHEIPRAQADALLNTASDAWGEQLLACSVCPNNCLTEGFELCGMFDKLRETGWPT